MKSKKTRDEYRIEGWPPDYAISALEKGYYVEALQVLHSWIEIRLSEILILFRKFAGSEEEIILTFNVSNQMSYLNLTQSLFCIGAITRTQYNDLLNFNKLRNAIIHRLFDNPYDSRRKTLSHQEIKRAARTGYALAEALINQSEEMVS